MSLQSADVGRIGTCADSIDVDEPHRAAAARDPIKESGGTTITVSDRLIRDSLSRLGRNEGVFVEPAGAAAVAGVRTVVDRGFFDHGDRVIGVLTGTGLKDTATALEGLTSSHG